jgi:hypothetical protein
MSTTGALPVPASLSTLEAALGIALGIALGSGGEADAVGRALIDDVALGIVLGNCDDTLKLGSGALLGAGGVALADASADGLAEGAATDGAPLVEAWGVVAVVAV